MSTTNDNDIRANVDERTSPHKPERPMKVVVDAGGCNWLCDANVDEKGNLADQGCWRCSEMAFTRDS